MTNIFIIYLFLKRKLLSTTLIYLCIHDLPHFETSFDSQEHIDALIYMTLLTIGILN